MNQNQWEKLDELFHAALEREGEARGLFVAEACDGDEGLRRELESMLAHHGQANSFIETPAYALEVETAVGDEHGNDSSQSLIGKTLGSYKVLNKLGQGGMGEVYLAFDRELQSKVALKFLRADLTGDQRRVTRFRQEARAARALNHPNILTIFEIGQADGRQFIATELVEGLALNELMKGPRLSVSEVLDITIQVAAALSVAHAAGIIHRDIKPENVMLRPDGLVKIVDFGVAKLTERIGKDSDASTLVNTEEGTAVGTIRYMSPEQARALDVDARTDIWSFGVVLYELLTGSFPFNGDTAGDLVVSILGAKPQSLSCYNRDAPLELERIVAKTLVKDREKRYPTMGELLADLREFRESLNLGKKIQTNRDRRHRVVAIGVVAAVVVLLAIFVPISLLRRSQTVVPANPVKIANVAPTERILNYSLTVQKMRGGKPLGPPFQSVGDESFENSWKFRLNLSSGQAGFLYILDEDPASHGVEGVSILYPEPAVGQTPIGESQNVQTGWYVFDQNSGTETVWLVWSASAVPELEAVRRFLNSRDKGAISDSARVQAVRDFLRAHSSNKTQVESVGNQRTVRANGDLLVSGLKLVHE